MITNLGSEHKKDVQKLNNVAMQNYANKCIERLAGKNKFQQKKTPY